ncbi:hypothetical protein CRV04_05070 [Candidatus Marinarcus aquaticus]|uniref:Beta-ketoacyl synthase N-terminal domain-containing protein n=2 Tax=Candidatus Marinarcus aquaticus TaxID=2044504 RepID=A0A4V1LP09_9BACT|nr:hypothetical protein CRV04_05070 [Candidatus Marinarcus aquaticus]
MYLHATSHVLNPLLDIKAYRTLLKPLTNINLRRSSKFNILAVYGALLCMNEVKSSQQFGVYVATEYGPIMDVHNVLNTVNMDDSIIMPFDFLNINSNNVSFYVSKALDAFGKNMVLTSEEVSFEKALQLALFDLETKDVQDVLVGAVDESLEQIPHYAQYTSDVLKQPSCDGSFWLYGNLKKEHAVAQIVCIKEYENVECFLKEVNLNGTTVSCNQFAACNEALKKAAQTVLTPKAFFGCDGAVTFFELLEYKGEVYHIAQDKHGKLIVITLRVF